MEIYVCIFNVTNYFTLFENSTASNDLSMCVVVSVMKFLLFNLQIAFIKFCVPNRDR